MGVAGRSGGGEEGGKRSAGGASADEEARRGARAGGARGEGWGAKRTTGWGRERDRIVGAPVQRRGGARARGMRDAVTRAGTRGQATKEACGDTRGDAATRQRATLGWRRRGDAGRGMLDGGREGWARAGSRRHMGASTSRTREYNFS